MVAKIEFILLEIIFLKFFYLLVTIYFSASFRQRKSPKIETKK